MPTLHLENQRIFFKEKLTVILSRLRRLVITSVKVLRARSVHWTKPFTSSLLLGTLADLGRSKAELVAENALLRVPLIILKRQVKRPVCTKTDRIVVVLLARAVRAWKQALFLVQEDDPAALAGCVRTENTEMIGTFFLKWSPLGYEAAIISVCKVASRSRNTRRCSGSDTVSPIL